MRSNYQDSQKNITGPCHATMADGMMHHKYTVAAEAKVPYYLRCRAPGSGFEAEIVCKMTWLLMEAFATKAVQRPATVPFPHPKL